MQRAFNYYLLFLRDEIIELFLWRLEVNYSKALKFMVVIILLAFNVV